MTRWAGERGKGERLDESLRPFRHHNVDVQCLALQLSNKLRRFVGSDATGDPDCDLHRTPDSLVE